MTCSLPVEAARASPRLPARFDAAFKAVSGGRRALGVAVSGGSDSTALLIAAARWTRENGVRLTAATVDHGLRPEAKGEAEAVARLCRKLGVDHTTIIWSPPASSVSQRTARLARHALLAGWARAGGTDGILLGHTRDDRIETFLIRARAGSGWWGLAGPLPDAPSPAAGPGGKPVRLLRPLLAFGREELRDWLREQGRGWADDPSNTNTRFERVRIRALAARLPPDVRDNLIRISDRLALLRRPVMAEALALLQSANMRDGALRISAAAFAAAGQETQRRLVEALAMAASPSVLPPRPGAVSRIAGTLAAHESAPASGTLAGLLFRRRRGEVAVSAAPRRKHGPEAGPIGWDRAFEVLADPCIDALFV